MKRFLSYVGVFALVVVLSLAVGEVIVRSIPNPYKIKSSVLEHDGDRIATLVLGSSHTYYGVVPSELGDSVFNLANISQNYEYDYRLLEKYAPLMPSLRRVIINAGYSSFFDSDFPHGEWWQETNYQLYMAISKHGAISRTGFEIANFPVYAGKLRKFMTRKSPAICDSTGFGLDYTFESRYAGWEHTGEVAARRHTAPDSAWVDYNLGYLRHLIALCRSIGAEPVIVTPPCYITYNEHLDKAQFDRYVALTDMVVAEYGLRWLDFLADSRFTADDFWDADHLNDRGAVKFTRILGDSLAVTPARSAR